MTSVLISESESPCSGLNYPAVRLRVEIYRDDAGAGVNVSANTEDLYRKVMLIRRGTGGTTTRNLDGNCSASFYADTDPDPDQEAVWSSGGISYDFRASAGKGGNGYAQILNEGYFTVEHDPDGTLNFAYSAYWDSPSGDILGDTSTSGSVPLPAIPRATTPGLSAAAVDAGAAVTINLPRASPSFTHDLSYSFEGGSTVSIATSVATSHSFTPPLSLLTQIPDALSGTLVLTVVTKNGGTTIGTKTANLTVTAPAAAVPDFTLDSVVESVAALITMMGGSSGPYLKLCSKPTVTLSSPAGYQGSTIAATKIEIGSQIVEGSAWTSGTRVGTSPNALGEYGTLTVKATVTDTRGRTRERSTTITVLNYSPPAPTGVAFKRATSGGVDALAGTHLKVVHSSSVASVLVSGVQKNALKYRLDYKLRSSSTWTTGSVTTPGGLTYSTDLLISGFLSASSYDTRLVIFDNTGSEIASVGYITSGQIKGIRITPDGRQGYGKVPEAGRQHDFIDRIYQRDGKQVQDADDLAAALEALVPAGTIAYTVMSTAPTRWLLANGGAASRTTYPNLYEACNPVEGTPVVTGFDASALSIVAHGLGTGQMVFLTTTGTLPGGLSPNVAYFAIRYDANTFSLATTLANALAGTRITLSGSGTGVHTLRRTFGVGNGSTTFNVPNILGRTIVGPDTGQVEFAAIGQTGGAKTHGLTIAELAVHDHQLQRNNTQAAAGSGGIYQVQANTGSGLGGPAPATQGTGSGTPHNNLQPYIVLTPIIKAS